MIDCQNFSLQIQRGSIVRFLGELSEPVYMLQVATMSAEQTHKAGFAEVPGAENAGQQVVTQAL